MKLEASGHTNPITYMGRDGRQYVALMATGGGGFLGGGLSNSLVSFSLPDIPRKPLPSSVTEAVTAAAKSAPPKVGVVEAIVSTPAGAKSLVEKTCGKYCHSLDVLASQHTDEKGWSAIVQNMVARGADASDAQVKVIAEYLSKNYGK